MSNLFGIAQKYDYLVSQIEENDGEITEEIAEELAIAESELEDKLRAYRQVIDAQKLILLIIRMRLNDFVIGMQVLIK